MNKREASFLNTCLEKFLNSVKNRDFVSFRNFFLEETEFYAELPGRRIFDNLKSFLISQEEWFNGISGSFDFKMDYVDLQNNFGTTKSLVNYSNVDEHGKVFHKEILLTVKFKNIDENWYVVYLHNEVRNIK